VRYLFGSAQLSARVHRAVHDVKNNDNRVSNRRGQLGPRFRSPWNYHAPAPAHLRLARAICQLH
jgi:hypothetical protein